MTLTSSVSAHCASVMMPSGEDGKMRGGVDEDVDAAVAEDWWRRARHGWRRGRGCRCEVKSAISLAVLCLHFFGDGFSAFDVAVGDHDVRAALCSEERDLAADAAASADDESDLAAELLFGRLAADLGLFESPVLDAEGFAGRERDVVVVHGEVAGAGCVRRPGELRCSWRLVEPSAPAPCMTPMALV